MSFIKTGTTTHSNNMDQRYLQLPFTANGDLLDVQLPSRAGDLPPGYYMLFVLNTQGVPSVARMVRVGISSTEPPASDFTPGAGGTGGAPFTLACEANEVVVGVRGSTATYVNQVGPLCVRVNQSPASGSAPGGARHHRHRGHDYLLEVVPGQPGDQRFPRTLQHHTSISSISNAVR